MRCAALFDSISWVAVSRPDALSLDAQGSDWTPSQDDAPPPPALPPVGDGTAEQPIDMTLAGADMDNDDELRKAIAVSLSENGDGTGPSPTGRATPANGHPGGGTVTFGPSMQEGTDQNALVSVGLSLPA